MHDRVDEIPLPLKPADSSENRLKVDLASPSEMHVAFSPGHRFDAHNRGHHGHHEHLHLTFDNPFEHCHKNDSSAPSQKDIVALEKRIEADIAMLEKIIQQLSADTAKPPVDAPKPPVDNPKPPVDTPKPPVDTPKPPTDKPPTDTPTTHTSGAMATLLEQNDYALAGVIRPQHSVGKGKSSGNMGRIDDPPPKDAVGYRQWGVIMPIDPNKKNPDATAQIANSSVYYHLKTGGWVQALAPEQAKYWEGLYYNDFRGNLSTNGDGKLQPDGSYKFSTPPDGKLAHFGPGGDKIPFDTNLYDGVFETMSARSNVADSGLAMQIGGDYLRPSGFTQNEPGQTAENLQNPPAGGTNWMKLTTNWQDMYYTSLSAAKIQADPPPLEAFKAKAPDTPAPVPPVDQPTRPETGAANFSVKNGQIIGPDGKQFIAKGINVDGTVSNADEEAILKNFPGLNFIRLATGPGGAPMSTSDSPSKGPDSIDKIQQFIDTMTAHGIVVEIENHAGGDIPTGQALVEEDKWFSQLAAQNKSNPYVWFGSSNEPWERKEQDAVNAVTEQQQLYKAIRDTGNDNMIMFERSYDKYAGADVFNRNKDLSSYTNVAIDNHYYNTNSKALKSDMQSFKGIKSADGEMPIIIGEYGPTTGPGSATDAAPGVTSIEAVQNAVNEGLADGAVAWCLGTLKGTSEKSWTDTDAILIPTNRTDPPGKGLVLTGWGQEIASWIKTGTVGTGAP